MEIRVTDYFSDDESFLFGNSTENSDEEGDEDEYKTIENGNKTHPHHIENNVTGEEWSPRLVSEHFSLVSVEILCEFPPR